MNEILTDCEFKLDKDFFEEKSKLTDEEILLDGSQAEKIRMHFKNKRKVYHNRFKHDYYNETGELLSREIYVEELEWGKAYLAVENKNVEVKIIPFEDNESSLHGFEISLNSRRFAVPRDSYSKIIDGAAYEEVNSAVVSVLIKDKWSDWLKDQLSTDTSTELTPETLTALREMASGNLIDEIRDTAICLGLGDKVRIDIKSQKEDGIDNALKKFGVDDIDELKRILRMTGLEIINTSDRLSDGESQSGYNSITEIDALLEAIHKSQKKRTTKRRKGWLKGAL